MGHPLNLFIFVIKSYLQSMKKKIKKFRGCYLATNFCTQSQWDLWVIFLSRQKSHVIFP